MNILLYSHVEISAIPKAGGIQRVTQLLANTFISESYNVFHAFYSTNNDDAQIPFAAKIQLVWSKEYEQLKDFLIKNKIDFIIFQNILGGGEKQLLQVHRAADEAKSKVIFCLHTAPDSCLTKPSLSAEFFRLVHGKIPKVCVKRLITGSLPRPVYNRLALKQTRKNFEIYNKYSDKIVLLSESHIEKYCEISGLKEKEKVTAISNPLTFDEFITENDFDKKQKEVLVLCRMSERQKRVSDSLKIWKKVQQKTDVNDWKLVIVGGGEDEEYLKEKAKKLKLKNYSFEGFQHPLNYYKRASIFMMTSDWEGFGMTLIEAQQMGVVPMAFDSFSALHDIINKDNTNGIIIKNKDLDEFAEKLVFLIKNKKEREILARNAMKSCKKFSHKDIKNQWVKLFKGIK